MNRGFWELNKYKLGSAFIRTALFLLALVFIFLITIMEGALKDRVFLFNIFLGFGLLSPALIFLVAYWVWYRERNLRNRVFAEPPLKDLEEIGFQNCLINENSKWNFTEEIKSGVLGPMEIYAVVKGSNPEEIFFSTTIELRGNNPQSIPEISKNLEAAAITFNRGYAIRKYDRTQLAKMTIGELKADLLAFIETLRGMGFRPVEKK